MFESQYHNYNDVITELQDYMLTNNLLKRSILYSRPMNTPSRKITNIVKTLNNSVFPVSCKTVVGGDPLTVVGGEPLSVVGGEPLSRASTLTVEFI